MARTALSETLEAVAWILVVWPASLVVLAVGASIAGLPVAGWQLMASAVVAVGSIACLPVRTAPRLSALALAGVAVALAAIVAGATYDGSYDGLWYHQEAIIRLAQGWIPLRESAGRLGGGDQVFWLDHYPKAAWFVWAATLDAFGRIELGKLFNLTMMAAAAAQAAACLLRLSALPTATALAIAGLAAVNPVAVYQSTSFYVDGWLASCLVLVAAAGVLYARTGAWPSLIVAAAASVLLINLKFTGLLYWAVAAAMLTAAARWMAAGPRSAAIRLGLAMAATGACAVGVVGYDPYIANVRQQRGLFYPVVRDEGIEPTMMSNNLPASLRDRDRVSRFILAHASASDGRYPPPDIALKRPFAIRGAELSAWQFYDVRIGGFGPLYSGLLLLAVPLAAACLLKRRAETGPLIACAAVVLASVFLHSEGWWARYAPQAWLVPLIVAAAAAGATHAGLRRGGRLVLAIALANVLVVAGAYVIAQAGYAASVRESLALMRASPRPAHLWPGRFMSLRQRLHEAGIRFRVEPGDPPPDAIRVPSTAPDEARWR